MAQASVTNTKNNNTTDPDTGDTVSVNQRNNSFVFSGASVFLASKVNDYIGGFIQWTYDNLATDGGRHARRAQRNRQHRHSRRRPVQQRRCGGARI